MFRRDKKKKRKIIKNDSDDFDMKKDIKIALGVICGLFLGLLLVILWANHAAGLL